MCFPTFSCVRISLSSWSPSKRRLRLSKSSCFCFAALPSLVSHSWIDPILFVHKYFGFQFQFNYEYISFFTLCSFVDSCSKSITLVFSLFNRKLWYLEYKYWIHIIWQIFQELTGWPHCQWLNQPSHPPAKRWLFTSMKKDRRVPLGLWSYKMLAKLWIAAEKVNVYMAEIKVQNFNKYQRKIPAGLWYRRLQSFQVDDGSHTVS